MSDVLFAGVVGVLLLLACICISALLRGKS